MNTKFNSHYCHNGREQVEKLVDLYKNQHKMGNELIKVRTPHVTLYLHVKMFRKRKMDNMIYRNDIYSIQSNEQFSIFSQYSTRYLYQSTSPRLALICNL